MSQPPPINPYDPPQPSSGASKMLWGLGLGCGLMFLVCCGGLGIGIFAVYQWVQSSISEDPARVKEITADIVTMEIPEGLTPKVAMDMQLPFMGRVMIFSVYGDESEKSMLMIGQFGEDLDDVTMETRIRESLRRNRDEGPEEINITQSETFETEVNGEKARFRIAEGKGERTGDGYLQVRGPFRGHAGQAFLMGSLRSPPFTKEAVIEMLNSMQ